MGFKRQLQIPLLWRESLLALMSVLLMLTGSLVYLLWRSQNLLMFEWSDKLGLKDPLLRVRADAFIVALRPGEFTLYSLPDAAWTASGILAFGCVWLRSKDKTRYFWLTLPAVLAIGGEILQAFGVCPGTFDPSDLWACSLASVLSFMLIYLSTSPKPNEN